MRISLFAAAVVLIVVAGVGYRLNSGHWPYQTPASSEQAAHDMSPPKTESKVLYYRNPMGLADTSPVPKKDSMGMDYIPVYADEEPFDANVVKVSLDRVQRSGVRTEPVETRHLVRPVRAPGVAKADERTL